MTYPVEIEIDKPHAEVIDEILTDLEWYVHALRERWHNTADRIVHTADLHELLAKQEAIAFVWDIDDVNDQRPDLTDEQAWEVLRECRQDQHCLDRVNEVMREMLFDAAEKLYPQRRHVTQSHDRRQP